MAEYVTCALCGLEFDRVDAVCGHGCPLAGLCNLVQCPGCLYEFPPTPRTAISRHRLFRRRAFGRRPSARGPYAERVRTVLDLAPGERATVVCLGGSGAQRRSALSVFGLVPGAELRLLQQHSSPVVQIGETSLALDRDIARDIVVVPLNGDEDGCSTAR